MKGSKDKSVVLSALGTQRTESSRLLVEGFGFFFFNFFSALISDLSSCACCRPGGQRLAQTHCTVPGCVRNAFRDSSARQSGPPA